MFGWRKCLTVSRSMAHGDRRQGPGMPESVQELIEEMNQVGRRPAALFSEGISEPGGCLLCRTDTGVGL